MSLIFYANLPDCRHYKAIRKHAHYDLREITDYLYNAVRTLKKKLYHALWEEVTIEEIENEEDITIHS